MTSLLRKHCLLWNNRTFFPVDFQFSPTNSSVSCHLTSGMYENEVRKCFGVFSWLKNKLKTLADCSRRPAELLHLLSSQWNLPLHSQVPPVLTELCQFKDQLWWPPTGKRFRLEWSALPAQHLSGWLCASHLQYDEQSRGGDLLRPTSAGHRSDHHSQLSTGSPSAESVDSLLRVHPHHLAADCTLLRSLLLSQLA